MTGWKKYIMVAVICLLLLGLMLYGDLGNRFGAQGGRNSEWESASVNNNVDVTVVNLGPAQVGDIINLFHTTMVPAVVDITQQQRQEASPEEMIASSMFYSRAYEKENYAAAPSRVEEMLNNNVWRQQVRLVDPNDPERDQLRAKRAGEMGTTVKALQTFLRKYIAGSSKEVQFAVTMREANRSEMALLYQISHERARIRYQSFPASQFFDAAKLEVAGNKADLQKEYDADKANPRTPQGETGNSMSKSLKLQFDMFWVEQDAFKAEEDKKIDKKATFDEYQKMKTEFDQNPSGILSTKNAASGPFGAYVDKDGHKLVIKP
ncbi:MAG TPA: hypothetical protein VL860_01050, partial [Planctomycetota bacterium]|nr:hypothetical protein [Planctomycetota bacterium]